MVPFCLQFRLIPFNFSIKIIFPILFFLIVEKGRKILKNVKFNITKKLNLTDNEFYKNLKVNNFKG